MTAALGGPADVTVRSCRYAAARPSSSDSDRTRFFWSTCADRDLRGGRDASTVRCSRLLDEMSGSTRGPRDPGGAVEGVAGPQERKAGEAAHQGSDAAPARRVADAERAGAGDLLGDPGFSIRVPTTEFFTRQGRTRVWMKPGIRCGLDAGTEVGLMTGAESPSQSWTGSPASTRIARPDSSGERAQ